MLSPQLVGQLNSEMGITLATLTIVPQEATSTIAFTDHSIDCCSVILSIVVATLVCPGIDLLCVVDDEVQMSAVWLGAVAVQIDART